MPMLAQKRGINLVILGEFNPVIFQPKWLASEGLLTEAEAEEATVGIIHPDVSQFELAWFRMTIERERFQIMSLAQPYFERVTGLTAQIFELLRHTPLRVLGINNDAHFKASSLDKWHELGHYLAPKEFWLEFFPDPGVQDITIKQVPRLDKESGHLQVSIQPSVAVVPGVYVGINDHFQPVQAGTIGATKIVELLKDRWPESSAFADRMFSRVAELL